MTNQQHKILNRYALVGAGFFMSALVGLDVIGELLCIRFPLLFYLILGAMGMLTGNKSRGWLQHRHRLKTFLKIITITGCLAGITGAGALSFYGANWETKCSFRYCGRALGIGLLKSPFPVGSPSCRMIHLCANEYPMNATENAQLKQLVTETGCPEP